MVNIKWTRVDDDWYSGTDSNGVGYWIRFTSQYICENNCVKRKNDINFDCTEDCKIIRVIPRYVGWEVGRPIIYWYNTLDECKKAVFAGRLRGRTSNFIKEYII